ncbi:response regulator receiver protein [Chondromyces apiculatus DSM 436]|uniref:Response regulator receiver protein n=1 Tax=Chondromyces apiculatus DSM 436 TaxID=1192034 RepID=A0A017SXZ0_9BACT|nr:response regulator receiver protein [Chondromyces apiculatus DSM 436]
MRADSSNQSGKHVDGWTVMLVDDDEAIVDTLRDVLEAEGYRVEAFTDALLALERLRAGVHVDMLVLDCVMPTMDGRQFMETLDAEGRSLPIVLVTALSDPGFCVDTRHPLVTALINKPFDLDQLLETLDSLRVRRSARAA